ncbi:hypothetical protein D9M71_79220 [compost metagenome]
MPLVLEHAVPHDFLAALRDRERRAGPAALQLQAIGAQLAVAGVLQAVLLVELRIARGTVGRVDLDAEIRVPGEQRLGAFGQLRRVLLHVLRGDGQDRLLVGERVRADARPARVVAGRRLDAAGVFRNGAVGIAGNLGAPGSQGGAELLGFFRRHGGQADVGGRHTEYQGCQSQYVAHG